MVSSNQNNSERSIDLGDESNASIPKKKLKRVNRKKLIRLNRKGLRMFKLSDINAASEFQLLRLAIFNGYFKNRRATSTQINVMVLREFLREKIESGDKIEFVVPKKMMKKSIDALVAEIPFRNLLLWCDGVKKNDYKNAAMHLWVAVKECVDHEPDVKIVHLVGGKCKDSDCKGYYRPWDFRD